MRLWFKRAKSGMVEITQNQESRDGSAQTQIGQQIIVGVSEKRVREICDEKLAYAIRDLTNEAHDVAYNRVSDLVTQVLEKISKRKLNTVIFSDPKFQREVVKAQSSAAAADRKSDIEMLSELLVARMDGRLLRKTHTGISRAIEIVSDIDDDELSALTVLYAFANFRPIPVLGVRLSKGLAVLDDLYTRLNVRSLPQGEAWMENLNMLDAIILSPLGKFKNVVEYYSEVMDGYVCVGIEKNSSDYLKAQQILASAQLPVEILVRNELLPGYVRLPFVAQRECAELPLFNSVPDGTNRSVISKLVKPSECQIAAMKEVLALYNKDTGLKNGVEKAFEHEWGKRPSLVALQEWVGGLHKSFEITRVGAALAYTNARRCAPGLPPLDLK